MFKWLEENIARAEENYQQWLGSEGLQATPGEREHRKAAFYNDEMKFLRAGGLRIRTEPYRQGLRFHVTPETPGWFQQVEDQQE